MKYRAVAALGAVLLVLQTPLEMLRAQEPQSGGPCTPPNVNPALCGQWVEIDHCTPTPEVEGLWLCPPGSIGWPWTEAIHAALTYTGKVVFFKNSLDRGLALSQNRLHYWDPATQTDKILATRIGTSKRILLRCRGWAEAVGTVEAGVSGDCG